MLFLCIIQHFSSHTTKNTKNLCDVTWYVGRHVTRMGNGYANHSATMFEGDELHEGTCKVLKLTEEFAIDLGTSLR
jgi:hypothetical protein